MFPVNVKTCTCIFQLKRQPNLFPTLRIKRQVSNIEDFKYEDFEVVNYKPHPKIAMPMAV